MISNPEYGWCTFKLRTFIGNPSYLTNVPLDLLNTFIDCYKNGMGMAWFDEEGSEFTLVINPYSIFIIEEREKNPVLHNFSEMRVEFLAKELISDIENDLDGWSDFAVIGDDEDEFRANRAMIKQALDELKHYVKTLHNI